MTSTSKNVFDALRPFSRKKPGEERCDLCGLVLAAEHPHLLERSDGHVLCACDPCAILFSHREAGKFVRIPRSARRLDSFEISDLEWSAFRLPIDMAFFVKSSAAGHVKAYYPSPAGSTESLLPLDAWDQISERNPLLTGMEADVECLLVNRTKDRRDYFIAPLDQCYKLTGLIRKNWRGFSGGETVWQEIDRFFIDLKEHARA